MAEGNIEGCKIAMWCM